MGHLGVSIAFSREKNLKIIEQQFRKDPQATKSMVNYLSRFTWVRHKKGSDYPDCKCLRCEGMNLIKQLEKRR